MKMIKISNLLLISLLILNVACQNSATEKETPNGFKYTVIKTGDGIVGKPNQLIAFHFKISNITKDTTYTDTYQMGVPQIVPIADSSAIATELGMNQVFRMLSVPDSIHVTRKASVFFKDVLGQPLPPDIDSTHEFTLAMRMVKILEMKDYDSYINGLLAKRGKSQDTKDAKLIDEYLAKKNITAESDTSGVRYVVHSNGGGQKPGFTDCVEVNYHGYFLKDGQTFDKNNNISFPLNGVIRGWTYGVAKLGVGDSATFYIPSRLAYGPRGRGQIPGDAILIFDIKLLKIGELDPTTGQCK
jgi:FKBP-type peptidyl-prolyl cis-trans isomerase FkpA